MAATKASREFVIAFGVLKTLAIVVGLALTIVSLMSVAGLVAANLWVRLIVAAVVALAVPLIAIDRLLPENDPERSRGLPTDVLALAWLGFGLVFVGFGIRATGPLLMHEGDRFAAAGMPRIASVTIWIAGGRPGAPPEARAPTPPAHHGATGLANAADASVATTAADASLAATDAAVAHAAAPDAARPERTPAELFHDLAPTVVAIRVRGPEGEGGGTGFFVDDQGTIGTNHHVIDEATDVEVKFFDGTRVTDVELLADDPHADLALLRVGSSSHVHVAPLGNSDDIVVGERAISIGNPLGLDYTLTDGLVSSRRIWQGRPMVQMSVPVSPGNSGGPLFDMHGEVIAITTAQAAGPFQRAENLNLAIPINALRQLIRPTYPNRRRYAGSGEGPTTW